MSFLSDRKQRVVHNNVVTEWKNVSRTTTQWSVNGLHLFGQFLKNLQLDEYGNFSLMKYADDGSIVIPVVKVWLMNHQEQMVFSWIGLKGMT